MIFGEKHPLFKVVWGKVTHFLHHNPIFYKVACIYKLLTWDKNNNFPNLWLDLDFQLEEKDIYKNKLQHIYTKYIVMNFWNWKIWTGLLYVPLYTFGVDYRDSIYDILEGKK
jgi:hypothetical protein